MSHQEKVSTKDIKEGVTKEAKETHEGTIGNYQLGKTIGQGTYGKVKLATDSRNGMTVAVKILEKANIKSEKQVSRIQREIRFLKLLHHSHIVKVFDVIETTDTIYIEYAVGGELFDYIVAHKRLKEKEARWFFRQIVSAVDYCHQNAVIHRDLKPENLLLDSHKNIKIIDFGFGNTYKSDTLLDTFCGSPFYASPEMYTICSQLGIFSIISRIMGKKYQGPEVDIWSLGVILYALLCGHLPFDDENMKDLYKKISTADFKIPGHVPIECCNLIKRMITVDPKARATLDEIINSKWLSEGPPKNQLPSRPRLTSSQLDKGIMKRLSAFGYKNEEVIKVFDEYNIQYEAAMLQYGNDETAIKKACKVNPIITTYYLLSEMLKREDEHRRAKDLEKAQKTAIEVSHKTQNSSKLVNETISASVDSNETSSEGNSDANIKPQKMPDEYPQEINKSAKVFTVERRQKIAGASMPSNLHGLVNAKQPLDENNSIDQVDEISHPYDVDSQNKGSQKTNSSVKISNDSQNKGSRNNTIEEEDTDHIGTLISIHRRTSTQTPTPEPTDGFQKTVSAISKAANNILFGSKNRNGPSSGASSTNTSAGSLFASDTSVAHHRSKTSGANPEPQAIITEIRNVSGWFMNVNTTSSKTPNELLIEVKRVLSELSGQDSGLRFEGDGNCAWVVNVEVDPSQFNVIFKDHPSSTSLSISTNDVFSSRSSTPSLKFSSNDVMQANSPMSPIHVNESMDEPKQSLTPQRSVTQQVFNPGRRVSGFATFNAPGIVVFQIEVCRVPRLNLYGLHFKRISGGVWSYKTICSRLLELINL